MVTTKYYPISYDTEYFTKAEFIKNAEEEYQGELEGLTVEDGFNSVEEAIENAEVDNLIYEVRWQNGSILDYNILEERK